MAWVEDLLKEYLAPVPYHTTSVKGHDQSGKTFGISNDIVDEIFLELSCVIVQKFILFGKRRFPNFITQNAKRKDFS